ncbi:GTP-binding protein, partial [Erysipelothrix rhusiopathiae]|nr:GTP-binding protein [Erysipelothrix rhusiopathiae]
MKIINISILAHVDAGKTSLTEALLSTTIENMEAGNIKNGSTITDNDQLEMKRGISIYTSSTSLTYNNVKINIIDTPGHMDFINEVEQALIVTDLAVLLIAANDRYIKPQTSVIYEKLVELNIPTIIFINKIDIDGGIKQIMIDSVSKMTDNKSFEVTNKKSIIDRLTLINEQYFNNVFSETDTEEQYQSLLIENTISGEIVPILKGSAKLGQGIMELLDFISLFAKKVSNELNLSALIYKKSYDEKKRLHTYIRIYSGNIYLNSFIDIKGEQFKVSKIYKMEEGKIIKTEVVHANDIAIIESSFNFEIGSWIGNELPEKKMPVWTVGKYTTHLSYTSGMRVKVLEALKSISCVNPFIKYYIDEINQDIVLILVGVIQKEVLKDTFKEKFELDIELGETRAIKFKSPKYSLEESIIMNTIDNPFWASMTMKIEPLAIGMGVKYETLINTGYLKKSFQNAIEDSIKSFEGTAFNGCLLTDYKVILTDAEFASPVSTPSDFRHSTKILLEKLYEKMDLNVLESVGLYTLTIPESSIQMAYKDLARLRAKITESIYKSNFVEVKGYMNMNKALNYSQNVLDYTNGFGSFQIIHDHYII